MTHKVAIIWRGDPTTRAQATSQNNRYHKIFSELRVLGIEAEPAVYCEEMQDEVRAQLMDTEGALVWVNPLQDGRTRERLDALLREVAATGRLVSAHPDTILKMGVKEVLHRTKHIGWGTDTYLYSCGAEFRDGFPVQLRSAGPRVIKQNRGNDGQGVWKVELIEQAGRATRSISVLEARRGSVPEILPLETFMARCEAYFNWGGCIIDQPFQPRLPDGMTRCYMSVDKVVGFGHQLIKALIPPPPEGPDAPAAQPGPRIMHGPDAAEFQALRAKMEIEWTPLMMRVLGIERPSLPIVWDADFLYGPRNAASEDTYVLCEINVSSVFPVPEQAPRAIAESVAWRLHEYRRA
jgi:hypothetical protein